MFALFVCVILFAAICYRYVGQRRQTTELLKTVSQNISCTIFKYDPVKKESEIIITSDIGTPLDFIERIGDIDSASELIHTEDAERYASVIKRTLGGERSASCLLRLKGQGEKKYRWKRLTLTRVQGKREKLIGTLEDAEELKKKELMHLRAEQYKQAVLSQTRTPFECDLTRGVLLGTQPGGSDDNSYDNWLLRFCIEHIHPEDREAFLKTFSRAQMLRAFSRGANVFILEFRHRESENAEYLWHKCRVKLVEDVENGNVTALGYIADIDKERRNEMKLRERAETDPLTKLLNRESAQTKVDSILAERGSRGVHAMTMIDLDQFKSVNDNFGHTEGDAVLKKVAEKIGSVIRKDDVAMRMGGDEFAIFFKDIGSSEAAMQKAQELWSKLSDIKLPNGNALNGSIGIALSFPMCTFEKLYKRADDAMYNVKTSKKGGCALYTEKVGSAI